MTPTLIETEQGSPQARNGVDPAPGHPLGSPTGWTPEDQAASSGGTQVLTFLLDGEEYGVDILRVQEIKGWDRVTPIPNTVECVRGVINLRGTVVPIIDLRLRFSKPAIDYSKTTVIIVLKVQAVKGERIVGLIVDAVSDVYSIAASQLREAPELGGGSGENVGGRCVKGLATVGEKLVILLDIDQMVLSTVETSGRTAAPAPAMASEILRTKMTEMKAESKEGLSQ